MKIVLATFGSRGDVQPMLALSLALKGAGHDVLLAGPPEKAGWAEELGCPYSPIGEDMTAFIDGMGNAYSFRSAVQFTAYLREEVIPQFDILPEIVAGADLTVGSSLAFALSSVAEAFSLRYRFIAFTPQLLPSGHHPFLALKHHRLPGWYNRMTWQIALFLDRFNITALINRKRVDLGLRPLRDAWPHIMGPKVIVASDRVIAPVPPDVAFAYTQTGYMHLDQPELRNPELEKFLGAGPPPLYAGFGSMPKGDQKDCVPLVVGAARSAGSRVIIARFWDDSSEFDGADDVFFLNKYPHLSLFPRVSTVIHHGGAGTTASSAVSGVPQIIVPHALDQYYWGHRVYKSGLGPKPIWRSRLTRRRLTGAIQECLSNDGIRRRAVTASGMIDPKKSLEKTVYEILRRD